jgi:hypothetical protein
MPPPAGHGHGPWVYDRYFDLLLHPTLDCKTCRRWFTHYDIHLTRDEPLLLEAHRVRDEILEQTTKAASEAKDQEIAALCQKLEEVQWELEEARQGKVSLKRRQVLGRLLTIPCSVSPSWRTTLSPTHPACHVLSRTGRASRAFHTNYHWDCLRSYLVLPSYARRLVAVMCRVL